MKKLNRALLVLAVLAVAGVATMAGMSGYYGGADGSGCVRCHEIGPMANDWAWSAHRNVSCAECHGSSFTANVRMHLKNLSRMRLHRAGEVPEQIQLRHSDVSPLVERCAKCHAQQHAGYPSLYLFHSQHAGPFMSGLQPPAQFLGTAWVWPSLHPAASWPPATSPQTRA